MKPRPSDLLMYIEEHGNVIPLVYRYIDGNIIRQFELHDILEFSQALEDAIVEYSMLTKPTYHDSMVLNSLQLTQFACRRIYEERYEKELIRFTKEG